MHPRLPSLAALAGLALACGDAAGPDRPSQLTSPPSAALVLNGSGPLAVKLAVFGPAVEVGATFLANPLTATRVQDLELKIEVPALSGFVSSRFLDAIAGADWEAKGPSYHVSTTPTVTGGGRRQGVRGWLTPRS
jgi:hypothetical protein